MGVGEELLYARHAESLVVELDADDVLFDLTDDSTLRDLDAAHRELDRRASVVPSVDETYPANDYVMIRDSTDTEVATAEQLPPLPSAERPIPDERRTALDAIASLRHTVVTVHRREVREYAAALTAAIELRLADLSLLGDVHVTVSASPAADYIRTSPIPSTPPPDTPLGWAIADAIAQTPVPGKLPGTLLSRAEAIYAAGRHHTL